MSILQNIYDSQCSPEKTRKQVPSSLRLKESAFLDAIEEGMGPDFIEKHWEGLCQLEDFMCYTNFCEGFRTGILLMLEVTETQRPRKKFPLRPSFIPTPPQEVGTESTS